MQRIPTIIYSFIYTCSYIRFAPRRVTVSASMPQTEGERVTCCLYLPREFLVGRRVLMGGGGGRHLADGGQRGGTRGSRCPDRLFPCRNPGNDRTNRQTPAAADGPGASSAEQASGNGPLTLHAEHETQRSTPCQRIDDSPN